MRLRVEPDVVALAPGDTTDLLVRVHNDGEDTCTPFLQVRGVDPSDVLLPQEVVAVPAGSVMTAVVRVRAAVDAIPGDQRIAIAVEDLDGGQGPVSTGTVLRIGARPDVAVEVDPVATVGRRGAKAMTILRNRSDRRLQIDLEGRGDGVRVAFRPSRVTLDPGETKRVRTRMRRAQRSWFSEIRHGAVITARGVGAPASTTATFTQRPSVPRPAVRTVAALTALAVWVAASVVVFDRINAEPEAGPDSGLVAGPAEPGPGRTSATGLGVAEEEPGVSLPVVIQGTVDGPRDPSGTTVTAERIGFGDEGTTTGLTKVVALAEVKLPRGNVLDVVRTTTDERGRFRIASGLVEDAFYRVTATRAGFEVGSFIVSTTAEAPEVTLAVALEPATGSLSGTVKDAGGTAVGGATVLVTDGSATYSTVTPAEGADAGRWTLDGLATPATYQVVISRRGFAAQTLIVELDGGQARTGVDAVLTADLGTIVGRVTDANPDPNQPSVTQGVGALTVTLAGPEARETRTLTVAGDLRGTFDLPGLPYGDYKVTFSGEGWVTREAEITVDRGLVRLDATATRSTGFVQGWVWQTATGPDAFQGECRYPRIDQRDGAGATSAGTQARPCGGVSVTVTSDEGDVFATASADSTGFFQIGGVPAGAYTLTLARPGYISSVRSIVVEPGGTFDLNPSRTAATVTLVSAVPVTDYVPLELAAPPAVCAGTVVLTLVDFRDGVGVDPVTDASGDGIVEVSNSAECDPAPVVTRIGASAAYRIDNVPLGPQTITVGGAGATDWAYDEAEAIVSVSAVDFTAVTLNILPKPRTLTLPAGTIRLDGPTGADRSVVVEVLNAAGTNVGDIGGTAIPVTANGTNAQVDLALVGPDRDLRLRAVGEGSPARGYATVTSASFELPPGIEPYALPLLAGPAPRVTVTAATTVTGRIMGFSLSPLALTPISGASVTFPAQSRTDAADLSPLTITTAADGTFSATVRAGAYLDGATTDRASGTFGAITVSATGYETRTFNPAAGSALELLDAGESLRSASDGTSFFLLYAAVGGDSDGDVGLDPAARDVTVPVSLLGASGASRTLSVALTNGTVLEGATPRATPTPTPTPPAAASVAVGTPGAFTFSGVRPGDYTVTVTGSDAVTVTTAVTVPLGAGTFTAASVSVVATTTVTGTVHGFDDSLAVVPMSGATVDFPAGSDPADPSGTVTATSAADGTFTATVRSGAYTVAGLGAVTVAPPDASHAVRSFEVTLTTPASPLRAVGVDAFVLNPALTGTGAGAGEFVLDPAPRDVRLDVSLLGAVGAQRPLTVTLAGGTITGVATTTATAPASTAPAHPASIAVGTTGAFGFDDVAPGTYTVTFGGIGQRGDPATLVVAPGLTLLAGVASVQATVDVTVTVSETVVLGSASTVTAIAGASVAASDATAADDAGSTDANGQVTLTLDSGATYGLAVTRVSYASPTGLTLVVADATTQSETVTLPAAGNLRVFGQVSTSVDGVSVHDGSTEVGAVDGLGSGTKSYAIDGLPVGKLLRVDFEDADGDVLVSRWIQTAQAGRVSVQLDQDAEASDIGDLRVTVEIAEHPDGDGSTPEWVRIELTEVVPADFFSFTDDGTEAVWVQRSGSATGGTHTVSHTFVGLATADSSTSLPSQRFQVEASLVTADGLDTLFTATSYEASLSGGWTVAAPSDPQRAVLANQDVTGGARDDLPTLRFDTTPGSPAAPSLTVVPQVAASGQRVDVSWSAPANKGGVAAGDLTYVVGYRAGSSGVFTELSQTGAGVTSESITGLMKGTAYEVRVRAVNTVGAGVDSAVASVTTAAEPASPTVTATTEGGRVTVSWTAPADDGGSTVTGYIITSSPAAVTETVNGATTSVTFASGFSAGTSYTFTVVATNIVGDGAGGTSGSVTPVATVAAIDPADSDSFATFSAEGGLTTTDGDADGGVYFVFDGTDDALDLGTTLLPSNASYTITAWVRQDADATSADNILSWQPSPFWVNSGTFSAGIGGQFSLVSENGTFPTDSWQFVAVTFQDGVGSATGALRLYRGSSTKVFGQVDSEELRPERFSAGQAYLGAHVTGSGDATSFWEGRIGLVEVWTGALSAAEIEARFNATKSRYGVS